MYDKLNTSHIMVSPSLSNILDLRPIQDMLEDQIDRLKKELTQHVDKEIARFHDEMKDFDNMTINDE